ncbi:MAG: hypothetical protein ABIC04_06780 [Nanoarchaeota archaeon]
MANITKKELKRQLFHVIFGILIVALIYLNILNGITLFILLCVSVGLCIISKRTKIPCVFWFLDRFEREEDILVFPGKGALCYLISSFVVVLFFPKDIAMASIIILALGDSVSHVVGMYGSITHPFNNKKFLEGTIAGTIIAFIGSFLILQNPLEAGAASVSAMIVEGINIEFFKRRIDDNILVPVVAAVVIFCIRLIFI